jgi:hypothetical protein
MKIRITRIDEDMLSTKLRSGDEGDLNIRLIPYNPKAHRRQRDSSLA